MSYDSDYFKQFMAARPNVPAVILAVSSTWVTIVASLITGSLSALGVWLGTRPSLGKNKQTERSDLAQASLMEAQADQAKAESLNTTISSLLKVVKEFSDRLEESYAEIDAVKQELAAVRRELATANAKLEHQGRLIKRQSDAIQALTAQIKGLDAEPVVVFELEDPSSSSPTLF